MTKKELEEQVKQLKEIIRELKKEIKNSETSAEGLEQKAFGLENGTNRIVTIAFDLEKNSAVIEKVEKPRSDRIVAEHLLKREQEFHLRGLKI